VVKGVSAFEKETKLIQSTKHGGMHLSDVTHPKQPFLDFIKGSAMSRGVNPPTPYKYLVQFRAHADYDSLDRRCWVCKLGA